MEKEYVYPFPELILSDRDWTIRPAPKDRGRINTYRKEMAVPLSNSKRDLAVRAHELGHLKWTPEKTPVKGVHKEWLYVVEEMRINNLLMSKAGVNLDELSYGSLAPRNIPLSAATGFAICAWKLKRHRNDLVSLDERAYWYAAKAYKKLFSNDNFPTYQDGLAVARWLQRRLGDPPKNSKRGNDENGLQESEAQASAPMRIVTASLTVPTIDSKYASHKRSPAIEGSLFIAPHRWCTDRAVFDRRQRERSATLLIDISGSMKTCSSDLEMILRRAPIATIATYNSYKGNSRLTIVAKNGRRVNWDAFPSLGGSNECDEPALLWLSRQKSPRYWISDGGVTGIGDTASIENSMNCFRAIKKGKIEQMLCMGDAVEVFNGRQKPLPRPHIIGLDFALDRA